jgi:hypothetical protein
MQIMSTQTSFLPRGISPLQHWHDLLLRPRRALKNAGHHHLAAWLLIGTGLALAGAQAVVQTSLSSGSAGAAVLIWSGSGAAISQVFAWAAWSAALYVGVMLLGGRSNYGSLFRAVVYAWLPYYLLGGVRLTYLLATHQQIAFPGLSGFAPASADIASLGQAFLAHFLVQVHLYLFWHLLLLACGAHVVGRICIPKALALVIICWFAGVLLTFLPQLFMRTLVFQAMGM